MVTSDLSDSGGFVTWEGDEVASHCASDPVWVSLLFSVVADDPDIGCFLYGGNVLFPVSR
jgi:hypothetical protein